MNALYSRIVCRLRPSIFRHSGERLRQLASRAVNAAHGTPKGSAPNHPGHHVSPLDSTVAAVNSSLKSRRRLGNDGGARPPRPPVYVRKFAGR
jgi:hypothetical protein